MDTYDETLWLVAHGIPGIMRKSTAVDFWEDHKAVTIHDFIRSSTRVKGYNSSLTIFGPFTARHFPEIPLFSGSTRLGMTKPPPETNRGGFGLVGARRFWSLSLRVAVFVKMHSALSDVVQRGTNSPNGDYFQPDCFGISLLP